MQSGGITEPGQHTQILLWDTLLPSSPKTTGREILRLSCTNVQKFSLSPTKPSPAAIPPADPPFPIHVINLPKPLQKSIPFGKNPGVSVASSEYVQ